jgi:hypothetical protein
VKEAEDETKKKYEKNSQLLSGVYTRQKYRQRQLAGLGRMKFVTQNGT